MERHKLRILEDLFLTLSLEPTALVIIAYSTQSECLWHSYSLEMGLILLSYFLDNIEFYHYCFSKAL